ncbi:MAG: CPBP family intramembrane metalloprotease [Puniceicoccales bacterium]|jgi:membrane protease YdiL (CAAX protease family)|nr:CPBP family intramembrane metalloprotease [Puniceicoccales bacterium]
MPKKQGLEPIEIELDQLFTILAWAFWIIFFVSVIRNYDFFLERISDTIIRTCIFEGIGNILVVVLLFGICRSRRWPAMNPLRMSFLNSLVVGVVGVMQLFPLAQVIGMLWQKVLSALQRLWEIECVEQPILALWRTELVNEGQFWGMMFLVVVLVPITEEVFFRYFFYRFWKSRLSPWRATLLVSFIFALLHFNLMAFIPLWGMGMFLTFLYERYGNLVPCVLVHGVFNYISLLVARFS